jgi:hypothetical protein
MTDKRSARNRDTAQVFRQQFGLIRHQLLKSLTHAEVKMAGIINAPLLLMNHFCPPMISVEGLMPSPSVTKNFMFNLQPV